MLFFEVIPLNTNRYKSRYRRNLFVLIFIVIAGLTVLIYQLYMDVNRYYNIEELNSYEWQRYMNEEEFEELKTGMTYLEVVEVAKGRGEWADDSVYEWKDELLMTQAYVIRFQSGKLISKEIVNKRGYSTRNQQ